MNNSDPEQYGQCGLAFLKQQYFTYNTLNFINHGTFNGSRMQVCYKIIKIAVVEFHFCTFATAQFCNFLLATGLLTSFV